MEEHRVLWQHGEVECVLISCCAGAELQLRKIIRQNATATTETILRELYPTKSDLYERARVLESEFSSPER